MHKKAKGFLFDLDGVFYVGNQTIKGGKETIEYLKAHNIPCRFVTNTTRKSLTFLHDNLTKKGIPIEKEEIISSPKAAVLHLRKLGNPKCHLVVAEDIKEDFSEFPIVEKNPEVVVIGDIGNSWNYDLINDIFRMMVSGAHLIALHKGRYFQEEDGLRIDIGVFVAGLEYACSQQATVIGKPSKAFFELALADMGLKAEEVAMVGDDIESDVGGAQKAGLKGVLVKTGKYRQELVAASQVKPDTIIESIADAIAL